jgi:hypothetical protein
MSGQPDDDGRPSLRGVWNGVGLAIPSALPDRAQEVAAETELDLPAGDYAIETSLDIAPFDPSVAVPAGELRIQAGTGAPAATVSLASLAQATRESNPLPLSLAVHHGGGKLPVRLGIAVPSAVANPALLGRVWATGMRLWAR